jgi:hypothetical protein
MIANTDILNLPSEVSLVEFCELVVEMSQEFEKSERRKHGGEILHPTDRIKRLRTIVLHSMLEARKAIEDGSAMAGVEKIRSHLKGTGHGRFDPMTMELPGK